MHFQAVHNPPNPWANSEVDYLDGAEPDARLQVYEDHSREIVSRNDSPDLGFRYSINPYRGCFHACAYCYARPSHEYLSFGAGTDFDRKIVIKPHASTLLREAFNKANWKGDPLVFSGVTDCYQPLEANYRLTRQCLEVCLEYKNPIFIITKSPLIERDTELLQALANVTQVHVCISIPFWDVEKARAMEPYVATPQRRIHTIEKLASKGISVGVNVAPIIPGLGDEDIGDILTAASRAGAQFAGRVLLRLPGSVKQVFLERLQRTLPLRADKVVRRIREARGGKLYDAQFGKRGVGEGHYAEAITELFDRTAARLGLARTQMDEQHLSPTFARPAKPGDQLPLF